MTLSLASHRSACHHRARHAEVNVRRDRRDGVQTPRGRAGRRPFTAWLLGGVLCGAFVGLGCGGDDVGETDHGRAADAGVDAAPDADVDAVDAAADVGPDAAPSVLDDRCRIADPPPVDAALAAALDAALAGALRETRAPGIAARVVLPDGRGWAGATGRDDIRGEAPLLPWGRFRIASVTKTFIAAAVMLRVGAGAWDLDAPVTDWVEGFDLDPGVTLRRLLNHTAGVFNYSDDVSFLLRRTEYLAPEEVVAFALAHDSGIAPGEGYLYSNTGYFLLGMALEALEQRPLQAILRGDLLDPVGLPHTWLDQVEPPPDDCGLGQGHVTYDPGLTEGFDAGWGWAAGGLAAPTADLCVWARALIGGEVLPPATIAEMSVPTELSRTMGEEPYGLGIMEVVRAGRTVNGHTGSTMGFRGEVFVDPTDGTCVAIQTNDFTARQDIAAEAVWSALAR